MDTTSISSSEDVARNRRSAGPPIPKVVKGARATFASISNQLSRSRKPCQGLLIRVLLPNLFDMLHQYSLFV